MSFAGKCGSLARHYLSIAVDPEGDLQHSAIWDAGLYLMILMQFLENKIAVELTRSEFVEAQEALDLIGPVYKIMDSFVGVREKTCIVFVYGLLLMRQHNPQDARVRLASGLKIAHQQLGNIQLVSQYLTILGTLALQLHDEQAREILKSSLTLAKTLYDIPTQIWLLSVLTALYQELGERENEMENSEYQRKKEVDLQKRLSEVHSSIHHLELIDKARINSQPLHGLDIKRTIAGPSARADFDIPESIGLPTPPPLSMLSRLRDPDSGRRGKKKI